MDIRLPARIALVGALLLTHCRETSSNPCGDTTNPQLACGAGAACVWTAEEATRCLPKCEAFADCADGEFCYPRPVRTSNAELLSANVCFPSGLAYLPQTEAELEDLGNQCRARELHDCGRDPRCQWEYAAKVDLEAECTELMPVGCYALATICTLSFYVAEDSAGELFVFAAGCGNEAYTPPNQSLDDPLYERVFEGETSVYEWPRCS